MILIQEEKEVKEKCCGNCAFWHRADVEEDLVFVSYGICNSITARDRNRIMVAGMMLNGGHTMIDHVCLYHEKAVNTN